MSARRVTELRVSRARMELQPPVSSFEVNALLPSGMLLNFAISTLCSIANRILSVPYKLIH